MIKYDFMNVIPCFLQKIVPCLITRCIHLGSTFVMKLHTELHESYAHIICEFVEQFTFLFSKWQT